jgi:hypothetical protein
LTSDELERRATSSNDERRTTSDERRATNDELLWRRGFSPPIV